VPRRKTVILSESYNELIERVNVEVLQSTSMSLPEYRTQWQRSYYWWMAAKIWYFYILANQSNKEDCEA